MFSGLARKTGDQSLDTYILTELREIRASAETRHNELRTQIEGRDNELRSQITSIREGVNNLSQSVDKSAARVEDAREELHSVKQDVARLKAEFDAHKDKYTLDQKQEESSWNGPVRVAKVVGWFSALLAALAYIYSLAKSSGIIL